MSVSRLGRTFSKKNPSSCFAIDRFAQSLCKWITSYKADLWRPTRESPQLLGCAESRRGVE